MIPVRSVAAVALRSAAYVQCRAAARASPVHIRSTGPVAARCAIRSPFAQPRWHSTAPSDWTVYDFEQVKRFSESPSAERIIIDVREPSEYEAGYIPTAINIPVKSQPEAIFLSEEEFEDRFDFKKPATDAEVIFYCRAGVRSSAAAQLARQSGYTNVAEYRGSWLDWEKNGGRSSTP